MKQTHMSVCAPVNAYASCVPRFREESEFVALIDKLLVRGRTDPQKQRQAEAEVAAAQARRVLLNILCLTICAVACFVEEIAVVYLIRSEAT